MSDKRCTCPPARQVLPSPAMLFTLLLTLAPLLDGHGHQIPRPEQAAHIIADEASRTELPAWYTAALDVLGAHESAYHPSAKGDSGKSCGAFQTPCAMTPEDFRGQTKLAIAILRTAIDHCPEHPIWMYASGRCVSSPVALRYEMEISAEMRAITSALDKGAEEAQR